MNFSQTKLSDLINYQGTNKETIKKFLRKIEKNQRNSINISDTIDKNRSSVGICVKLWEFKGLKRELSPEEIIKKENKESRFFLRYFLNMYNLSTKKMYGNSFQSPLYEIKIEEDNEIKLLDQKPFYAYVLSPDPVNDAMIIQFVVCETDNDNTDNIKSQICERWSLIRFEHYNSSQDNKEKDERIFKGSPRSLFYYDFDPFSKFEGNLLYTYYEFNPLQKINFLLPDYIILAEGEVLPGLMNCIIGPKHNFNDTVHFETVYIKNIIISISPKLEQKILDFAIKYRDEKYKMNANSYNIYNNVYIKERKLKCGVHNTWCFINTNGLENSVTLTKKDNNLNYLGVLTVDHFFVEESLCGFILELDYVVTIPIVKNQKEETLVLPIGYSIFIPERIDDSDQIKRTNFITGPSETIYGEKLWFSPDVSDRLIELSFIISENQELVGDKLRENEFEEKKELLRQAKNNFIEESNLIIQGSENTEAQKLRILELESKIKNLEIIVKQEEEKRKEILSKQKEISQPEAPKEIIKYITKPMPDEPKVQKVDDDMNEEKRKELNKNIDLFNTFEKLDKDLDEYKKSSQIIYEEKIKNMGLEEDIYPLISLGEKNLALPEIQDAIIEYNLQKELESQNFGNYLTFQFLSFKPSKLFFKQLENIPKKIQFKTNIFNQRYLETCVCNVTLPENSSPDNLYYFGSPLILVKENIGLNTISSDDSQKEIKLSIKYDPSVDKSIDFRDFVKFLTTRYLVVEIIDVEKKFCVGIFKIPLNDLLRKEKEKVFLTKELPIYDDDFVLKGYIQMLLQNTKINTLNPFLYNRSLYRKIDARSNRNNKKKKKKVCAATINLTNYRNMVNLNQNISENNENYMKFKTDLEIKKKIQVTRFLNATGMGETKNRLNGMSREELKLRELKQKQLLEEKLNQTKTIRDHMKPDILSRVTQDIFKSEFEITLIQGQPFYLNYSIFNDSDSEELFHIVINKVNNSKDDTYENNNSNFNNEIYKEGNIITIINNPEEWARIVNIERLEPPNDYNVFSKDLYFSIQKNERIPILIKLLSYREHSKEDEFNVYIYKNDGRPYFLLNIKIKSIFPIYDHIFHYHLPCNTYQKILLVNPFKSSQKKTMEILNYYQSTDIQVNLAQEATKEFSFMFNTNEEGFIHEFILFLYSDEFKNNLYLTWKFEIHSHEIVILNGNLGKKMVNPLYINYIEKNNANSLDSKLSLQLFTDRPEVIYFPKGYDTPFDLIQNSTAESKFILYPKNKNRNSAIINCVNVNTRELYKSWLIQYTSGKATISSSQNIECYVGSQTNIKYECVNPIDKWVMLRFESSDDNLLYVVDSVIPFNGKETKYINIIIPSQITKRKFEVLLFISDEKEEYSKTVQFLINFK